MLNELIKENDRYIKLKKQITNRNLCKEEREKILKNINDIQSKTTELISMRTESSYDNRTVELIDVAREATELFFDTGSRLDLLKQVLNFKNNQEDDLDSRINDLVDLPYRERWAYRSIETLSTFIDLSLSEFGTVQGEDCYYYAQTGAYIFVNDAIQRTVDNLYEYAKNLGL